MTIDFKASFVLTKGSDSKPSKIVLQVFLNQQRARMSTGLTSYKQDFDPGSGELKGKSARVKDENLILQNLKAKAYAIITDHRLKNQAISMDRFKHLYYDKSDRNDFLTLFEQILESRENEIGKGTIRTHKSTLTICRTFQEKWAIECIDEAFIKRFGAWLSKSGRNLNYRKKILSIVRTYMNLAKIDTEPIFKNITLQQLPGEIIHLLPWEKARLVEYYKLDYILPAHRKALQCFLFAVFTGLRKSDVYEIDRSNIANARISFYPVKTANVKNKAINFKLPDAAKPYINQYGDLFTHKLSDVNKYLKQIAKILKINPKISFHSARHTFATDFLRAGGKVDKLQLIMGHSDIRMTMRYVHLVNTDTDDDIQKLNKFNDKAAAKRTFFRISATA